MGLEGARQRAEALLTQALTLLEEADLATDLLKNLAERSVAPPLRRLHRPISGHWCEQCCAKSASQHIVCHYAQPAMHSTVKQANRSGLENIGKAKQHESCESPAKGLRQPNQCQPHTCHLIRHNLRLVFNA